MRLLKALIHNIINMLQIRQMWLHIHILLPRSGPYLMLLLRHSNLLGMHLILNLIHIIIITHNLFFFLLLEIDLMTLIIILIDKVLEVLILLSLFCLMLPCLLIQMVGLASWSHLLLLLDRTVNVLGLAQILYSEWFKGL